MRSTVFLFSLMGATSCFCQSIKTDKAFQVSLAPAISSNGFHPGGFNNLISINLTSGYSAANYIFELGVISNLNVNETRGLQIAGIANTTGANSLEGLSFKQVEKKQREGFEANLSGLQLAGVTNVVLNNVFGGQLAGGFNIGKGALMGFQLSGLGNTIYKYSFGAQVAGVYNVSRTSMDGLQIASLFNSTEGGLSGVQISLANVAGFIEGKNSYEAVNHTAVQIGAYNRCKAMNGFQIGLVNVGGRMQGTQIGLINFYKNGKTPETRDGTSIGLINIGSTGYLSVYCSEIFPLNIEVATGTVKNRRIAGDRTEKQIQNALIYSRSLSMVSASEQWALGYGIKKFYFNRSGSPGMSRMNFLSVGADVLQVNQEAGKITKELNLVTRPQISVGSRFHPKNKIFFFFASLACSMYSGNDAVVTLGEKAVGNQKDIWPGFAAGVLIQ